MATNKPFLKDFVSWSIHFSSVSNLKIENEKVLDIPTKPTNLSQIFSYLPAQMACENFLPVAPPPPLKKSKSMERLCVA